MMKLFLDTSSLLSVFDRSDQNHSACSEFWKELLVKNSYEPVISDYVLDELTTRIRYDISHGIALQVLNSLSQLVERRRLSLVWVDRAFFDQGRFIFERFHDHEFSFTDCTSFAICRQLGIHDAFALDSDFQIFGLNVYPSAGSS